MNSAEAIWDAVLAKFPNPGGAQTQKKLEVFSNEENGLTLQNIDRK